MSGQHDLSIDPSRDLIVLTVSGFFSSADVAALEHDLRQAQRQLRCAPNQHVTLCDASRMRIQTQAIVAEFARIARDASIRSRRVAFVLGESLARTQTRRLPAPGRTGVGYFDDVAAAEAWLCDGASDGRPATPLCLPVAPVAAAPVADLPA